MESKRHRAMPESLQALEIEELRSRLVAEPSAETEEELWRRVEPQLRRSAAAAASAKAPEAMDRAHVVQQALDSVRLDLARLAHKAKTDFSVYLSFAVRSKVSDQARRYRSANKLEVRGEAADDVLGTAVDRHGLSPEELLIELERAREKQQLARLLPKAMDIVETSGKFGPRQMTAIRLRWWEDLEVDEIADRIGMKKRTTEKALKDGLAALREVLRTRFGVREPGTFTPPDGESND